MKYSTFSRLTSASTICFSAWWGSEALWCRKWERVSLSRKKSFSLKPRKKTHRSTESTNYDIYHNPTMIKKMKTWLIGRLILMPGLAAVFPAWYSVKFNVFTTILYYYILLSLPCETSCKISPEWLLSILTIPVQELHDLMLNDNHNM